MSVRIPFVPTVEGYVRQEVNYEKQSDDNSWNYYKTKHGKTAWGLQNVAALALWLGYMQWRSTDTLFSPAQPVISNGDF